MVVLAAHLFLASESLSVARDRPAGHDSLVSATQTNRLAFESPTFKAFNGSLYFDSFLETPLGLGRSDTLGLRADSKINLSRMALVSGSGLAVLGGLYLQMHKAWWNNGNSAFRFYNDDWYVRNVDKAGHLYGGVLFAEVFGAALTWPGYDEETSALYGGLVSALIYTGIEIKDGFAPQWGFSVGDVSSSVVGAFYPYMQKKIPLLEDFNFKWSYWPSKSPYYTNLERIQHNDQLFADDYEGQTFWLSVNVRNFFPASLKPYWPEFLNLAGGLSVEKLDGNGAGNLVFIFSPDIDLTKVFKTDSKTLNTVLHLLNLLHLPLPALRVSPGFRGYGLYLHP